MKHNENYELPKNPEFFPKHNNGFDIPQFIEPKPNMILNKPQPELIIPEARDIQRAAMDGERINNSNIYHLKELGRATDAYTEEEAHIVIRHLVSNYPEIVLNEVAILIRDMEELSTSIIKSSKGFAQKRGND